MGELNHVAWARSMIGFIRERGLEAEFQDWCGGWPCRVASPDDGWQPIESAPRDRCILLASLAVREAGNGPQWSIVAGYWDAEFEYDNDEYRGAWTDDSVASWGYEERTELHPIHWLPLPPPPADLAKECVAIRGLPVG